MVTRLTVPFLDANMIDVTVTAWRKKPGDLVQAGEIVAELTTDKATFELEASGSGTVLEILAAPKSIVPSGYILALLGTPGEADPAAVTFNQALMEKHRVETGTHTVGALPRSAMRDEPASDDQGLARAHPRTPPTSHLTTATGTARIRATPRARRLAQEQGLDLARIQTETGAAVVDEAVLQKYLSGQTADGR